MLYKYSVLHILHTFSFALFSSYTALGILVHFTKQSEALEKLNDLLRLSDSSTFSYLLNQLASQTPDQRFLVVDLRW